MATPPKLPSQKQRPGPARCLLQPHSATVILERSLFERVKRMADERGRSFSRFTAELLADAVKAWEELQRAKTG